MTFWVILSISDNCTVGVTAEFAFPVRIPLLVRIAFKIYGIPEL